MNHPALRAAALALVLGRWCLDDREDPVLAVIWAVLALGVAGLALRSAPVPWQRAPLLRIAAALAAWALLSTLWSADRGTTLASAVSLAATVALATSLLGLPAAWRAHLAWTLLLGAAVASALALRQVLFGFPALREAIATGALQVDARVVFTARAGRAFGSFFAPDLLAGGLIIALPLAGGLLAAQRGPWRLLAGVCTALVAFALIATRSVGGGLALAGAAGLGLVLWSWRRPARGWRLGLAAALAVTAALLATAVVAPRWQGTIRRGHERWINQRSGLLALTQAPVLGHGHDTYGVIAPGLQGQGVPLTRYAHGLLGQSASDGGAPGLLLALGLVLAALGSVWRSLREPTADVLERAAAVGLIAGVIHALVDYDLIFGENQLALWCAAVLATRAPSGATAARPSSGRAAWPVPAAAWLVAALGLWRLAGLVPPALAARGEEDCLARVAAAERSARWLALDAERARSAAIQLQACAAAGASHHARAAAWMEQAVQRRPRDAILRAEHGLSLARAGRADAAWSQLARAQQQWPTVSRLPALEALAALTLGDPARGQQALQRALAINRRDPVVEQAQRALATIPAPPAPEAR